MPIISLVIGIQDLCISKYKYTIMVIIAIVSVMLIKAIRLHPGVPLQVWICIAAKIDELAISLNFIVLALSSAEGHC